MKKVWVNRFNAYGSIKPMNEWYIVDVPDSVKTVVTHINPEEFENKIWTSGDASVLVERKTKMEYIGNQRGDGWFYVADSDLPPKGVSDVIASFYDGEFGVILSKDVHNTELNEVIRAWQPIMPLKFL